jgi:hypothetical protein
MHRRRRGEDEFSNEKNSGRTTPGEDWFLPDSTLNAKLAALLLMKDLGADARTGVTRSTVAGFSNDGKMAISRA